MARPLSVSRDRLIPLLMRRGPVSATDLAAATGVNRSTVVRALSCFGPELVVIGSTRATRYLLRRAVPGAGDQWPIYCIQPDGAAERWAMLEALHDRNWRITWPGGRPEWADAFSDAQGMWEGFPFFLSDLRPQGFLGRATARQLSRFVDVPEDPRQWSDDHTVLYLQAAGEDVPGSLVLGDAVLMRAFDKDRTPVVAERERSARFPFLAEEAMRTLPGSSAGGEQPKFLTRVADSKGTVREVLVKYSPPMDQTAGRRWADLLSCESIALGILADRGLALPGARCFDLAGRRFLEVPRFDRTVEGGRRGVVSLSALCPEADFHGLGQAWPRSAADLLQRGLIGEETHRDIARLHAFGEWIGNTDRHGGNLSFWLDDRLPFRLAPAYDMLPMFWAPGAQGEVHDRSHQPAPPMPRDEGVREETRSWAMGFWDRVGEAEEISPAFRRVVGGLSKKA
jgi:hypothetical protein